MIYGGLPLMTEEPELEYGPLGELDIFTATIMAESINPLGQAAALGFTRYQAIPGYAAMFVERIKPRKSGKLSEVQIFGAGLATSGEKRLRRISCASQQVSVGPVEKVILVWDTEERGEDEGSPVDKVKRRVTKVDADGEPEYKVIATPSGIFDRWNIAVPILNVEDTYFATIEPPSNVNGTANTPPSAPTPPSYIWGGYEPLRGQHPNGWILENRTIVKLYSGLSAVTDSWGYYFAAVPD